MKRRFATYLTIFSLVITTQLGLFVGTTRACGEKAPETLLSLYKMSDVIVVAKYGGAVRGAETERYDTVVVYDSTQSFDVVSTIKGEPVNRISISDSEYVSIGKEDEPLASSDGPDDEEFETPSEPSVVKNGRVGLETGDTVLVFLSRNDETGKLEPADYVDAFKRMPDETLAKYVDLIKRLDSIHSSDRPNFSALIEWLLDAADDPDTRWEATFELLNSVYSLERYETLANKVNDGDHEAAAYLKEEFGEGDQLADHTMNLVRLLTDVQKDRLAAILLRSNGEEKAKFVRGDGELVELVSHWKRSDVTATLLDKIRGDLSDRWQVGSLMYAIARSIGDEELDEIAQEFGDDLYRPDKELLDDDDEDAGENDTAVERSRESEAPPETNEERPVSPAKPGDSTTGQTEEIAKPKQTYGERRAVIKTKFIERADLLLAMR